MLESLREFMSNNATLVLVAISAIIIVIAFVIYRRNNVDNNSIPTPTPSHNLDGMDNVNSVCDLSSGVCHPQNITPEQEQQIMLQQQMMMQQMQQQQNTMEQQNSQEKNTYQEQN